MNTVSDRQRTIVYTSVQVRELDRIAIEEYGTPGYELMTRAAKVTLDLIQANWHAAGTLCVLCGAGNNAGDGYVLARLAHRVGWQVIVYALVDKERLRGDAARAYDDYIATGGVVKPFCAQNQEACNYTLIVDALLGTGLGRDVSGHFAEAVIWINQQAVPVVAIDIPSGLDADTGQVRGCAVVATHTMTYIGMKQGLLTGKARDYVGTVHLDDLQVKAGVYEQLPVNQWLISERDVESALPKRSRCGHKGSFGHSLLVGGTAGMSGAIRLAAEATLRTGSGLVTVATHPAHADWLNLDRPELMVSELDDASVLRSILTGKSAVGIGPGLGRDSWAQQLLLLALDAEIPLVVDADALNLLAQLPRRQDNWILTPHPAEAARLLGWETKQVEQDRIHASRCIQQQYGGVCVLKGAGSLITSEHNVVFCTAGNPGMASGGMGDVLTGIITGLLAQGLKSFEAAYIGVQVHAMAADQAAITGERGLLASDVIEQLRSVVNP